mmetsp:Transcript_8143/g.10949  ORF Transcript_8143/g.10949 Transcript_8143/m.10949 type:complete len:211 (+) Transcript_8143:76-708(+)
MHGINQRKATIYHGCVFKLTCFLTQGHVATIRARISGSAESPLKFIGRASKARRSVRALKGNIQSTGSSTGAPFLAAFCTSTAIRILGDIQVSTTRKIALLRARCSSPNDIGATTVGPTIVKEAGERRDLSVAAGCKAFFQCAVASTRACCRCQERHDAHTADKTRLGSRSRRSTVGARAENQGTRRGDSKSNPQFAARCHASGGENAAA